MIILLAGGSKVRQQRDIEDARELCGENTSDEDDRRFEAWP